LVLDPGMIPVVPPKSNRMHPWDYDHAVDKKRNEVDVSSADSRASVVSSRVSRNSTLSLGFVSFALIIEALCVV
jgi:hypothetical protein